MDEIKLLEIIEKEGRVAPQMVADRLGSSLKDVEAVWQKLEQDKVILGYSAAINWDLTDKENVTALIEVKVMPQRDQGFDKVAQRIYQFPQVSSCYLMSGGFDLMLIIEDSTLKEVANFVSHKISTIEGVMSTGTHFILKKYKDNGIIFDDKTKTNRQTVVL